MEKSMYLKYLPLVVLFSFIGITGLTAGDWPSWRGPNHNGVADPAQSPPLEFGLDKAVKWSADLPGRAHGSACIAGERVFIATADVEKQVQAVNAFDRTTGKPLWSTVVHEKGLTQKINQKASWASATPACDGERIFINFLTGDAIVTTALDLDGKKLWQTKITDYLEHQGYGSSPVIHENLVIVSGDNKGASGGAVCGLDRKTGAVIWRHARTALPNYPSPIVLEAAGKMQLFLTGIERVTSLDPLTGKVNWEIAGATTECVTTTPTDGKHIYSSGGYPKNHIAAIAADGSGKVVWETNDRVYVPSMLIKDGHLYATMDGGVALCLDSATGAEKWKGRLGGTFSASPVLVGEKIYAVNESGDFYIFKADPTGLEILAKNKVGDEVFATPSICGGNVFLRVAFYAGEKRSERLICFGE
ncbi:MAG: PQQ-binding-like beta-propeller repeat protein [Verrucomicrobiales bacterium]|nr:PQQ-binding-like beta-propeller repeat protein [Verrucomicrobiales bacterium]